MATIGSLLQMLAHSQKFEFLVKQLFILAYNLLEFEMVCVLIGPKSPWYQETFTFLKDNAIPPHLTKTQQQTFIHRCACYTILRDTLFRRHFDGSLQRRLDKQEVEWALREVHEGIYGEHLSGLTLAKKLLRT